MLHDSPARSGPALRAPLAGLSALLVFGLLVSTFQGGAPAAGELRRESPPERLAVRQLTSSIVKAARHLVGSDSHKPCVKTPAIAARSARSLIQPVAGAEAPGAFHPPRLRAEMIDLPPPALRA